MPSRDRPATERRDFLCFFPVGRENSIRNGSASHAQWMGLPAYGRGAGARGFVARVGNTAPFAVFGFAAIGDFAALGGAAAPTISALARRAPALVFAGKGFFG